MGANELNLSIPLTYVGVHEDRIVQRPHPFLDAVSVDAGQKTWKKYLV